MPTDWINEDAIKKEVDVENDWLAFMSSFFILQNPKIKDLSMIVKIWKLQHNKRKKRKLEWGEIKLDQDVYFFVIFE